MIDFVKLVLAIAQLGLLYLGVTRQIDAYYAIKSLCYLQIIGLLVYLLYELKQRSDS